MTGQALGDRLGGRGGPIAVLAAIVVVYLIMVYGTYQTFTSQIPSGNDFYPRWRGTRAVLLEGKDPYSEEVTLEIQKGIYGRPAREDEDQVAFAYPLYVSLFVLPFALLSYPLAQAFWLSALILAALAALIIILRTLDWHPSPAGLAGLALWTVLFYPTARSIMLGQISIIVLALVALALWTLKLGHKTLAGSLLALSTIKPQMVFLVVPFLLLMTVRRRDHRTLAGFLCAMGILLVVSWMVLPGWMPSFVAGLSSYHSYTEIYRAGTSPIGYLVAGLVPPYLSGPMTAAVSLGLGISLAFAWFGAFTDRLDPSAVISYTVVATLLLPGETGTTNQVLLLLPIIAWLSGRSRQRWLVSLVASVLFIGPWALFLLTVQGDLEHPMMVFLLPIATLVMVFLRASNDMAGDLLLVK